MLSKLLLLLMMLMTLGEGTVTDYVNDMNLGGRLFLVNREFLLPSDYEPSDLVFPDVPRTSSSTMMRKEGAEALENLFATAKEEGLSLVAVSGYRSYGRQNVIFANKVEKVGKEKAMLLVAPPGTSEHQLGFTMDIGCRGNVSLTESFGETPEGKWVAENCARFGFIVRYPKEWTDVTLYSYEPWHIRYVGVEHAQRIHEMEIPMEYYIDALRNVQYTLLTEGE